MTAVQDSDNHAMLAYVVAAIAGNACHDLQRMSRCKQDSTVRYMYAMLLWSQPESQRGQSSARG